ncbi:hypothetical protein GCK72_000103 [Caenorhabditis remanei]|uniref:Uncharacterized protein n=1 Tax=Caenorhabditis remanei TaxID=31234 RepID=A0A6A5HMA8_CAERE|nr:hypothetical protein GCK72_000103 [Caenorhabditis remanei]KAF1768291.1 hypothetical protein GCK72_000103 [Caenorhabditis remanei]
MNILLGIILLYAHLADSAFVNRCYEEDDPMNIKNNFDSQRSEFAIKYNIANMNELLYDPNLEKIARSFKSCDDLKDGFNYQIAVALKETNAVFEQFLLETNQTDKLDQYEKNKGFGDFHPLQTGFIACEMRDGCPRGYSGPMIYMLSPRGKIRKSEIKYGKPGSACTNGTTSNPGGLCKVTIDEGLWPFPYYEDEEAEIDEYLESRMNTTVAEVEITESGAGGLNFFCGFTGLAVAILFRSLFE